MSQQQQVRRVTLEMSVLGVPTSLLFLGIGVPSLIISLQDRKQNPDEPDCGQGGSPPLRDYLFGTGISYSIIALSFCVAAGDRNGDANGDRQYPIFSKILGLSNMFLFCWMIVGCVSLWRDAKDCQDTNPTVYKMGMAAVILSLIMNCCGGFVTYSVVSGAAGTRGDADGAPAV